MLILTKVAKYRHCSSENIVKDGFTKHRNQRVLCKDCHKMRVLHPKKTSYPDTEAMIWAFVERLSLCGISRVFMVSYYWVYKQ